MFKRKSKKVSEQDKKKDDIKGLWKKCEKCANVIYNQELEQNLRVCPACGYHYQLNPYERIQILLDPDSFKEQDENISPVDPLNFSYSGTTYKAKLKESQINYNSKDAMIIGKGKIFGKSIELGIMDFRFLGGSMGSVVGEKFVRGVMYAIKYKIPYVVISASGGARMQEGMVSLIQMAKTSAALNLLSDHNIPYVVILTHPTTGGVTASFAMLGDIIIAEPSALIGFAGPRVIEQTIKQKLPPGFQSSEFQLDHGFVDIIVERKNLKETLFKVLNYLYDW
ncbi:MAG TPA: acetyl-CoA carboxylase, carboxyltransferase subunit beta [Spirochaetota bacterium]|nr:acetyl-CoA carboxylase, carboxyltransferase subunit beta [Spirochaetota bacterium]HOM39191.1 acetyl-CoA carboxylase, carboxyltransferase subunit beta [Spirochaetota bacterium]